MLIGIRHHLLILEYGLLRIHRLHLGCRGYRYLKVDYEDDGYVLNAEYQGPIIGLVVRF
jgi:hypothetical protein